MGYRYVEIQDFEPEDFANRLCSALDQLTAERGAKLESVSMSTMIGGTPESPNTPTMRRIAQVLVWQPDEGPERKSGKLIGV